VAAAEIPVIDPIGGVLSIAQRQVGCASVLFHQGIGAASSQGSSITQTAMTPERFVWRL